MAGRAKDALPAPPRAPAGATHRCTRRGARRKRRSARVDWPTFSVLRVGGSMDATATGPRGKDAPAWTPIRSFSEELAKLFAQREPGPVQPALDRGHGQVEGVRDLLVGEPVHVLQQEHRPIVLGQAGDRLVDRAAQL